MSQTYDAKVALLGGIVDYAGTFPPAALPLASALEKAATFRRTGTQPWLMGRMTLPVADLKKLSAKDLYRAGADGSPWLFTALATPPEGSAAADFSRAVEVDLREIRRWNEKALRSSLRQAIVAYEMKLPVALAGHVPEVLKRMQILTGSALEPYLELEGFEDPVAAYEEVSAHVSYWLESTEEPPFVPGLKFRTGGKRVPSPEELARIVQLTTTNGLRFKATQGLHAAITHGTNYGFVNLFAALTLARARGAESFGESVIRDCLACEDKNAFVFGTTQFQWRAHRVDLETIERARQQHNGAFGSCSIDEPDESLAKEFT